MRFLFAAGLLALLLSPVSGTQAADTPQLLEAMTWPEVRDAVKDGSATVIVPTGGTEQNGPHIALGKHNYILGYTAQAVAARLGKTLVAPILPYVPEGDVAPATGHMRFAGTLSLSPAHFALVLEDIARSLKAHGFTLICFLGEHGGSQATQAEVAARLSKEWQQEGVRVVQIGDYYDAHNGQVAWLKTQGEQDLDPEAHGGLADTSEMLALRPQAVREGLRGRYGPADADSTGASGPSDRASRMLGAKLLDLKINAAVAQIKAYQAEK